MTFVKAHQRNIQSNLSDSSLSLFAPALSSEQGGFFGETFAPEQDGPRLSGQRACVAHLMSDGSWRTLPRIAKELIKFYNLRASETSISARLRDMRRAGWKIERQRTAPNSGLWVYRAVKEEAAA